MNSDANILEQNILNLIEVIVCRLRSENTLFIIVETFKLYVTRPQKNN